MTEQQRDDAAIDREVEALAAQIPATPAALVAFDLLTSMDAAELRAFRSHLCCCLAEPANDGLRHVLYAWSAARIEALEAQQ